MIKREFINLEGLGNPYDIIKLVMVDIKIVQSVRAFF